MESVTNTTPESGDTDSLAVGHAGLYKMEKFTEEVTSYIKDKIEEPKEILADIELGLKDGGKTLITCEKGIKTFVKDELAKGENHLPNSELGVWIHYLTEGIKKDFGRTWNETPKSLRPKRSGSKKTASSGKRIITKSEKNLLLKRCTIAHYDLDRELGRMTLEDVFDAIREAEKAKQEIEALGYVLSPNKTEGIKTFDSAGLIKNTVGYDDAVKTYKKNKVQIVVPDIMNSVYLSKEPVQKAYCRDMLKSVLGRTAVNIGHDAGLDVPGYDLGFDDGWTGVNIDIKSQDELLMYIEDIGDKNILKQLKDKNAKLNCIHIVKMTAPGMMADRYVCFDLWVSKDGGTKNGTHVLLLQGRDNKSWTFQLERTSF